MEHEIVNKCKNRMEKALVAFSREIANFRAGRASASLLDRISISYYGTTTPINQLASISIPEARMLIIQPYDRQTLKEIEKAIIKSDLGINPSNDGSIIRLAIPALTEERRKELVKLVKKSAEEAKVGIRNIRRDGNEELKKLEKAGDTSEDLIKTFSSDIQKLTDEHIAKIDKALLEKEKEIMEV